MKPFVALLSLWVLTLSSGVAAQAAKAAPVTKAKAVELYTANCQVCHGPEGKGTAVVQGSAFVDRKWKHGTTPKEIEATIANGVPATLMLPFKEKLTPAEISALASLVRSFDKSLKPAGAGVKK
jgi:cytochrome c oxidase cbb3-type subunit 3